MTDVDVVVVGAGPAGAAAAIELSRAGRSVAVIDRARFPRDKICGDGLTTGALRRLEHLGLRPSSVPSWTEVTNIRIRAASGNTIHMPLPVGDGAFAAIATRHDLDRAVVDLVVDAGIPLMTGEGIAGVRPMRDHVVVETAEEDLTASFVVAADGMWSPTRKLLGISPPNRRGEWHAFRQYVNGVEGPLETSLFVSFEHDILPGYFWSFPLPDGAVNIGFGISTGGRHRIQDMKRMWPDILSRPHIAELLGPGATPAEPHRAWPIPCDIDSVPLTGPRTLFVGDAASVCDPMTGEGIGQALESGMLAARALTEGDTDDARVRLRYERLIDRELGVDQRFAAALTRPLSHRKGVNTAVAIAGATDWTRRNFARWMFEDYPRAILGTPRRWHRGMLSGHGAFRDVPRQLAGHVTPRAIAATSA